LADAKNRLSEVVTLALTQGPQRIRRRNQAVIVVSESEYERLTGTRASLKSYLLSGPDFGDLQIARSEEPMRETGI
jgi:prevent-host-death family protein